MTVKQINQCLACGNNNLSLALDLGQQPLANSYLKHKNDLEERYPLAVNLCSDCFHIQLTHAVDQSIIYKNYLYVSGTSKTLSLYSKWFAGFITENIQRKTGNVLDIGCNDGSQLDWFKDLGFHTYGIDPAENIYPTSSARHDIICDFFNHHSAKKLSAEFDCLIAQNVFAHNHDPLTFLDVCKSLMGEHTKLFIQTSQADMVLNNEFDTIYHEHVNFFNINSMSKLTQRSGLVLLDVIKTPIHGNSYLFVIAKSGNAHYRTANAMTNESSLYVKETYTNWKNNVETNMSQLKSTIKNYQQQGYKIVGYGAAAKGNTLLNFINESLDFIIDDNPLKQGLFCPGTRTPIVSKEILDSFANEEKIMFVPLAWNFFNEIRRSIKSKRNVDADVFLKYFPKVSLDV